MPTRPGRSAVGSKVVEIELLNRSGVTFDADDLARLCRRVLAAEGVADGELGVALVPPEEMRKLKAKHLGIDEVTDVLSFPIDALEPLPAGIPRALGDVVLCPQVVGDGWRGALVHGLLHLVGYDHGAEMERREAALLA